MEGAPLSALSVEDVPPIDGAEGVTKNLGRKYILQDLENEELDVLYKLGCFSPAFKEVRESEPPRCVSPREFYSDGGEDNYDDPAILGSGNAEQGGECEGRRDEQYELTSTDRIDVERAFLETKETDLLMPIQVPSSTLSDLNEGVKKSSKSDRKKSSKKSKSPRRSGKIPE